MTNDLPLKPSEMISQWTEEQAFLARAVHRIPYAMRLHHYRCLQRVEKLIAQHGIVTTVVCLLRAYRQSSKGCIYDARTVSDLGARPLGMLFLARGNKEISAPLGLLLAVHDLAAAADRIDQFKETQYLSPAIHRRAQSKNASSGRPNARTREERLMGIGRELKRRGWIIGRLKDNIELIDEMKAKHKCCKKDVLDAASKAGLRGKRGRPKNSTGKKMAS